MKKSYLTAVLTLTCALGMGISAHAQDADAVVVTVPFQFVAGSVTLPAGEYKVSRVSSDSNQELAISGYNKGNALLLPVAFDDSLTSQPTLSFRHVGGKYFLSRIKTLGGVYTMPASPEMIMLGHVSTPDTSTPSGTR
jgi:hypothetical protein